MKKKFGAVTSTVKLGKMLLLLSAMLLVLAACSPGGGADSAKNKQSGASAGKDAAAETIKVWLPPFSTGDVSDETFWREQLNKFEEKHGVKVELEIIPWSNYEERYLTAISSENGPDVGYMYMEMLSDYIKLGTLEPLDDYFTQEEKDNYIYWDKGTVAGKQYAVPIIVGNVSVLYANMDILKKSGFTEPPKTWDDLVAYARKIQQDSPDVYPFVQEWGEPSITGLNHSFYPYLWQAGGELFNKEGTELALDSPEALKAIKFLNDLKHTYKIIPDAATSLTTQDLKSLLPEGKVAMAIMGTSLSADLDKAGINWDYTASLTQKQGGTFAAADSLVMLRTAKNKELAAELIKFLTSPEVMEAYHQVIYSAPPISKNEKYYDNPKFEKLYTEDSQLFHTLTPVDGSSKIYDALYKNLQLMILGQLTPEQVLKDTAQYAKSIYNR